MENGCAEDNTAQYLETKYRLFVGYTISSEGFKAACISQSRRTPWSFSDGIKQSQCTTQNQ